MASLRRSKTSNPYDASEESSDITVLDVTDTTESNSKNSSIQKTIPVTSSVITKQAKTLGITVTEVEILEIAQSLNETFLSKKQMLQSVNIAIQAWLQHQEQLEIESSAKLVTQMAQIRQNTLDVTYSHLSELNETMKAGNAELSKQAFKIGELFSLKNDL